MDTATVARKTQKPLYFTYLELALLSFCRQKLAAFHG
jgi:hypothetical protein